MTKKRNIRFVLGAVGVLAVAGLMVLAGMSIEYYAKPSKLAERAAGKVFPKEDPQQMLVAPQIESIFLTFDQAWTKIPMDRYARGGGLTIVQSTAIVITHSGKIYSASGADDLSELAIETPDYGFEAYRELANRPDQINMGHTFWSYRYHDIMHYTHLGQDYLAITYTHFDDEQVCFTTTIKTLKIPSGIKELKSMNAKADDWETLFKTSPCLPLTNEVIPIATSAAGARLAYDPAGVVYFASGDYRWDGNGMHKAISQLPEYDYGKVIAIDLNNGEARHISQGHRNMHGIAIDGENRIWTVEHGNRGGDELNLIIEGRDYGWPVETLGTQYSKMPMPNTLSYGRHDVFEQPIFAFLPSVAISSLNLIDGFHPSWDGDLLMGTLKDRALHRFRIIDGHVQFNERIPVGGRVRYAEQLDEDTIVMLFDDSNKLVFLTISQTGHGNQFMEEYLRVADMDEARKGRLSNNLANCLKCHSLTPGQSTSAPSLANVFGSKMGSTNFADYSDGFPGDGRVWDAALLRAYLKDPDSVVSGSNMRQPGLRGEQDVADLVGFLEAMKDYVEFNRRY